MWLVVGLLCCRISPSAISSSLSTHFFVDKVGTHNSSHPFPTSFSSRIATNFFACTYVCLHSTDTVSFIEVFLIVPYEKGMKRYEYR